MNIDVLEEINKKGFAEEEIDPTNDIFAKIKNLKKKKIPLLIQKT